MAAYTTEQQAYIVRQLAGYVPREAITLAFIKIWKDTVCELEDVRACERDKLLPDWQAYFDRERAAFLDAPTNDKQVRLAMLSRMARDAEARGAPTVAADFLAQIAKEQEGYYGGKGSKVAEPQGGREITEIVETIVDPIAPAVG